VTLRLIDTHAHLNMPDFDADLGEVVSRASSSGVERILDIGTDVPSSRKALSLSRIHPSIHAAAGIHPHEASKASNADLDEIELLLREPKVVALGEIGLDYHYNHSPGDVQQSLFRKQIEIGIGAGKPLIIHVREAMPDALRILRETGLRPMKGVFHCFGGSLPDALSVLEMGFYISFTGVITFRNFSRKDVVSGVPLDRILLETDCPYMAPVPMRGKRNEPAMLVHTVKHLSEMLRIEEEELASRTSANAATLFGLD
jgi:TatD DNase family protein